jgi:hypothetical protein
MESSTELRSSLVDNAVKFLQDPQVRNSSAERQLSFLKSKGLTEAEITEAMSRTGNATNVTNATGIPPPLPPGPPPSRTMVQNKFDWGRLFLVLAFIGSTGAALSHSVVGVCLIKVV